jgi:DNA polymerase-3 subunit delta'
VKWLKPEGKMHLHTVDSIKGMIEDASMTPFEASKKVYVLEEADRCLPASSNALLKTLEEPPPYVFFILLSSHEEGILPTIASRCTRVPFYPIEESLIVEELVKRGVSKPNAELLSIASQGSFSRALELVSGVEDPIAKLFQQMLASCFLQRPNLTLISSLDSLEKLIEKKEEEVVSKVLDALFSDLLFWLRDLHYLKLDPSAPVFHSSCLADLQRQAEGKIPSLENTTSLIEESRLAIQRSSKPKVVLEQLFYKVTESNSF